jgi:hypothetical protein
MSIGTFDYQRASLTSVSELCALRGESEEWVHQSMVTKKPGERARRYLLMFCIR